MIDDRTLRQRLVAEIGEAGQRRLAAASARVGDPGLPGDVEARYLACAGFASMQVATASQARVVRRACAGARVEVGGADPRRAGGALVDALAAHLAGGDAAVLALAVGAARALDRIRRSAVEDH